MTLSAAATNGTVELRVRDQGGGSPSELRGREFDRFSRAPGARILPGAGLGLTIVETIALAHRGEATAAIAPDGGADVGDPTT
jgi:signal transduction histidine kinase